MKRHRFVLATLAFVGIGLATAAWADAPSDTGKESFKVRLAKAKLVFAELGLKRVEQINARVAETVPGSIVAEFRRDVDVENRRLQAVNSGKTDAEFNYWLNHVQAVSREALDELENARMANKTAAGTVGKLDVDRMQVRAEFFQLLFEQGQKLASNPLTDRLSWQNEVLLTEVQQLNVEVFRNRRISGDHN